MPFTPLHMGPGILSKSLLQSGFSLWVFGWTQILMDIQPLMVLLTGEGHLHGFTHTYVGASIIAILAALSGKYLAEFGLKVLNITARQTSISIAWRVVLFSAFIGSFSHVLLDSMMHADLQPFFPFSLDNPFLGLVSISGLHKFCFYSAGLGLAIYAALNWCMRKKRVDKSQG